MAGFRQVVHEETYIGDITPRERRIVWGIWKHLEQQIRELGGGGLRCPQCQKDFRERWQLCEHLSSSCTALFDQCLETIRERLIDFGVSQAVFDFLKEKIFAFFGQQWCFLCGKMVPSSFGFSLQSHLIHFHLKRQLLEDISSMKGPEGSCPMPSQTYLDRTCGRKFNSQSLLLGHLARQHARIDQLLREDKSELANFTGTEPVRDDVDAYAELLRCTSCGVVASSRSNLNIHLAGHQRREILAKSMGGKECGFKDCHHRARFSDEELVRHYGLIHMPLSNIREDTENEQKHFQCVQCYKLFSTNEALSAHKKIHAEIDQCKTTLRKCLPEVIDIDDSSNDSSSSSSSSTSSLAASEKKSSSPSPEPVPELRLQISGVYSLVQTKNKEGKTPEQLQKEDNMPPTTVKDKVQLAMEKAFGTNYAPSEPDPRGNVECVEPSQSSSSPPKKFKTNRPYKCPICHAAFKECADLQSHIGKMHFWSRVMNLISDFAPFVCPHPNCGYMQRSREFVTDHIIKEHTEIVQGLVREKLPSFSLKKSEVGLKEHRNVKITERESHQMVINIGGEDDIEIIDDNPLLEYSTESDTTSDVETISPNDDIEFISCDIVGSEENNERFFGSDPKRQRFDDESNTRREGPVRRKVVLPTKSTEGTSFNTLPAAKVSPIKKAVARFKENSSQGAALNPIVLEDDDF